MTFLYILKRSHTYTQHNHLFKEEVECFVIKILKMKAVWPNIDHHTQPVLFSTILNAHDVVKIQVEFCVTRTDTKEWPGHW